VGWFVGLRWLLLAVLFVPLGTFRYELWEARPQPLLPLIGTTQILSVQSDVTYLTLEDPAWAKAVLSPRGEVGAGRGPRDAAR
jgi:hypothetical protein